MLTKVQRWGNSLGLRIPRTLAAEAAVGVGTEVDVSVQGGDLIVKPTRRKTYRLEELLREVNSRNLHSAVETGEPVGREVW